MKNTKNKNSESNPKNAMANYDPKNRDFQRTEEDIDDVSKSEREEMEKRKQRTEKSNSTPDRKKIN